LKKTTAVLDHAAKANATCSPFKNKWRFNFMRKTNSGFRLFAMPFVIYFRSGQLTGH
jgi:hypothetical protein